jgi:hypothetical protein
MLDGISEDRVLVPFGGAEAASAPLTWGQKTIFGDMLASGDQFSMRGRIDLPEGGTVADAAARVHGLMVRHASLRMHLGAPGQPGQEVAGSGELGLDVLTFPHDATRADVARYRDHLYSVWPLKRFDFAHNWPLRVALLRHRGACLHLVFALSHLAADGGGLLLLLTDLLADATGTAKAPQHPDSLDIARSEQGAQLRQLSTRTMRYWESRLRDIPPQTFSQITGPAGQHYSQARFSSPAAHLAMQAICRRTGTDASRVTLAIIATAIGRATGTGSLTLKVMVNNRFRPGMADVIAPVAQHSVITVDMADTSVDEVVARTRGATLTAGMRAYYDPDDLSELTARLDAERGYPARITLRVNDQRAMIVRPAEDADPEPTAEQIQRRLAESTLTWLGSRENMQEQVLILIENRRDAVSLYMMWDQACLTDGQVQALLRSVEDVAVEAAFDPQAPTKVSG